MVQVPGSSALARLCARQVQPNSSLAAAGPGWGLGCGVGTGRFFSVSVGLWGVQVRGVPRHRLQRSCPRERECPRLDGSAGKVSWKRVGVGAGAGAGDAHLGDDGGGCCSLTLDLEAWIAERQREGTTVKEGKYIQPLQGSSSRDKKGTFPILLLFLYL